MILTIDEVNVTSMVARGGFKRTRNDIDGPNAGRALDGRMIRDRVTTKIKLEITTRPLKDSELSTLLNAIYPEYVDVTWDDPRMGRVTRQMYSNNNPATCSTVYYDGTELWDQITFSLIEV